MKRKINGEWHRAHKMPADPTRQERVEWHAEHTSVCGCRPVPAGLATDVNALRKATSRA